MSSPARPAAVRTSASVAAVAQQRNRSRSSSRPPVKERSVPGVVAHPSPPGPLADLDAERHANHRWPFRAAITGGLVVGIVVALIFALLSVVVAVAIGILAGVGIFLVIRRAAPRGVVRNIGAGAVESGQLPRVETLLEGLSVTMGVATPAISVLLDEVPNATIVAAEQGPTIIVTTGLVSALSVVELEGVLAHLLAQQRLDAVQRGTTAAGIALLLGGIGRRRAHGLIGRGRLLRADELAALAVRYPPGLAAALGIMERAEPPVSGSFFASGIYDSLRWLFVDPSIGRRSPEDALGDPDATSVRRRALEER